MKLHNLKLSLKTEHKHKSIKHTKDDDGDRHKKREIKNNFFFYENLKRDELICLRNGILPLVFDGEVSF